MNVGQGKEFKVNIDLPKMTWEITSGNLRVIFPDDARFLALVMANGVLDGGKACLLEICYFGNRYKSTCKFTYNGYKVNFRDKSNRLMDSHPSWWKGLLRWK